MKRTMYVITRYASTTYYAQVYDARGKKAPMYKATCTAGGEAAASSVVAKWYGFEAAKTVVKVSDERRREFILGAMPTRWPSEFEMFEFQVEGRG